VEVHRPKINGSLGQIDRLCSHSIFLSARLKNARGADLCARKKAEARGAVNRSADREKNDPLCS